MKEEKKEKMVQMCTYGEKEGREFAFFKFSLEPHFTPWISSLTLTPACKVGIVGLLA